jgi:hypothetical protein
VSGGLTKRELLDLFDRTEEQPILRAAIRQTLRPSDQPRPLLYDDEASVERLAAALLAWGSPSNIGLWDDGGRTAAAAIIAALVAEAK